MKFAYDPIIVIVGTNNNINRKVALNVLNDIDYLAIGFVFTKNKNDYQDYLGTVLYYDKIDETLIKNILAYQSKMINKYEKLHNRLNPPVLAAYAFVIFDNMDLNFESPIINEIIGCGKYYNITRIIIQNNYANHPLNLQINYDYNIFTDGLANVNDMCDFCSRCHHREVESLLNNKTALSVSNTTCCPKNLYDIIDYNTVAQPPPSINYERIRADPTFLKWYDIFLLEELKQKQSGYHD